MVGERTFWNILYYICWTLYPFLIFLCFSIYHSFCHGVNYFLKCIRKVIILQFLCLCLLFVCKNFVFTYLSLSLNPTDPSQPSPSLYVYLSVYRSCLYPFLSVSVFFSIELLKIGLYGDYMIVSVPFFRPPLSLAIVWVPHSCLWVNLGKFMYFKIFRKVIH